MLPGQGNPITFSGRDSRAVTDRVEGTPRCRSGASCSASGRSSALPMCTHVRCGHGSTVPIEPEAEASPTRRSLRGELPAFRSRGRSDELFGVGGHVAVFGRGSQPAGLDRDCRRVSSLSRQPPSNTVHPTQLERSEGPGPTTIRHPARPARVPTPDSMSRRQWDAPIGADIRGQAGPERRGTRWSSTSITVIGERRRRARPGTAPTPPGGRVRGPAGDRGG